MIKPILQIEKDSMGTVTLKFNRGTTETHMWFDDEDQFQAFVFLLKTMVSMGAVSCGCEIPDQESSENNNQENSDNGEGYHKEGDDK